MKTSFSKTLRNLVGDNVTAAAKKIGIEQSTLQRYVSEERAPQLDILIKIADYYKCSIDYLVGREEEDGIISVPLCNTNDERELLTIFGRLNQKYQRKALGVLEFYEDEQNCENRQLKKA